MNKLFLSASVLALTGLVACQKQEPNQDIVDVNKVQVNTLSPEMLKVRNFVPPYAVLAHRGSTFWVPEETESAFRWSREIGADYIEADLQTSKDGVVLALHDDNLKRTTDIENVFGDVFPERTRRQYYADLGLSPAEIETEIKADKEVFIPNIPSSYTYEELMMLDAGKWFNEANLEQARPAFVTQKQYISTLEDLVEISRGKIIKRDASGKRIYTKARTNEKSSIFLVAERNSIKAKYTFDYDTDPQDTGNRPGIYLEFKEPWLNIYDFEQIVYDELDRLGMNIITRPEPENAPFYLNNKINVGNTNGKVILQTFSLQSLGAIKKIFQGKIPMCFLLWKGTGATDIKDDSPAGYASFINLGVDNLAHFIGPSIAGAPNNYPELLKPWQAALIRKSKMGIHPYSFDTQDQMKKYFGDYNWGNSNGFEAPYLDAMFTNRAEMTLQYFIDKGVRKDAPQQVENSNELLTRLGY